jgi:hypothetical protein
MRKKGVISFNHMKRMMDQFLFSLLFCFFFFFFERGLPTPATGLVVDYQLYGAIHSVFRTKSVQKGAHCRDTRSRRATRRCRPYQVVHQAGQDREAENLRITAQAHAKLGAGSCCWQIADHNLLLDRDSGARRRRLAESVHKGTSWR